jgi:hypothetical protein
VQTVELPIVNESGYDRSDHIDIELPKLAKINSATITEVDSVLHKFGLTISEGVRNRKVLVISDQHFPNTKKMYENGHVKWIYYKKRLNADIFELRFSALIDQGWHIYSQKQPENSVAIPSSFLFDKNSEIKFIGKVKEQGKLISSIDSVAGISQNEYEGKVDFVQLIKMRQADTKDISVNITFQLCTDETCLPPRKMRLSL